MHPEIIPALEGDPDGQVLALRAFKNNKIGNAVALGPVGGEERASIFPMGAYAGRDLQVMPVISRLDLKSSNIGGLAAMGRRCSDERTKLLPIMILSSSKKDQELSTITG
jgi:two-component system response regulator